MEIAEEHPLSPRQARIGESSSAKMEQADDGNEKRDWLSIINENSSLFERNKNEKNEKLWGDLFYSHFRAVGFTSDDDCLYYVKWQEEEESPKKEKDSCDRFFVRRKEAKGHAEKGDSDICWEETFFLNLLLHHYEYQVQCTYPTLYFAIDDFHEAWKDITLESEEQLVCVELFAHGEFLTPAKRLKVRLFAGALDYSVIKKEYAAKKWMWSSSTSSHFFNLKGPGGKGAAQMMVAAQPQEHSQEQEQEQDEVASPTWSGSLGRAFRRLSLSSPSDYSLSCSLTSLNANWDLLMRDLLSSCNKHNL